MTATNDRFSISSAIGGAFVLVGALDLDTLPEARDMVEEFRVPGGAVVLDVAGVTFIDTMTIHWLVELADDTGFPVQIRNAPDPVRLVLGLAGLLGSDGGAWMIDDAQRHASA